MVATGWLDWADRVAELHKVAVVGHTLELVGL